MKILLILALFYYPGSTPSQYFATGLDASSLPYNSANNMAWCTGTCDWRSGNYGSAPSFTSFGTGNTLANPLFTNYSTGDLSLASGSPALAGGAALTTVASGDSGTGTTLVVTDADYFQAGWGISTVSDDCIAVGTVSNHVCVTAVNYSTNTLTLSGSISRSSGQNVWLYSDSSGKTGVDEHGTEYRELREHDYFGGWRSRSIENCRSYLRRRI